MSNPVGVKSFIVSSSFLPYATAKLASAATRGLCIPDAAEITISSSSSDKLLAPLWPNAVLREHSYPILAVYSNLNQTLMYIHRTPKFMLEVARGDFDLSNDDHGTNSWTGW
ncbi:hypothetical protein C8R41DRAFT_916514 [Lentinula lateritia]|uniref:Uncharacterized protein n=1 Tax=Lentinula lateritia TaxID=40482 RepID=A0ABQ8VPF2_9AGAR|nr:hypothetical protein C8R41DRAFT_916514 [Lentinula lateritia]